VLRQRVERAVQIQKARYEGTGIRFNSQLTGEMLETHCKLGKEESKLFRGLFDRLGFSMRAHDRVLKVARTIADLDGSDQIKSKHLAEAAGYRAIDKKYWGM